MSARGRVTRRGGGRTHRSAPTRGGGGVWEPTGIGAERCLSRRGGTEPAPYGGGAEAFAAGCGHPALRVQRRWCQVTGRCRYRPLRPAGGRGTARRVVVPYGRQLLLRCPKFFARIRSQNFDRCHSFLLAFSATGGARKRPPFHKGAFGTRALWVVLRGKFAWAEILVGFSCSGGQNIPEKPCNPRKSMISLHRKLE